MQQIQFSEASLGSCTLLRSSIGKLDADKINVTKNTDDMNLTDNTRKEVSSCASSIKRARTGATPTKLKDMKRVLSGSDGISCTTRDEKRGNRAYTTKFLQSGLHNMRHTNDEIHSVISFCPVMSAIVDTPAFQRLRDLKQLGTAQYVYMNGNHTRFEHSLGVAHLAEKLIEGIRKKQPAIRQSTTEKDVLCIKLAGLLHDLGHGPFSHTYEMFVKDALPRYLAKQPQYIQDRYSNEFPELPTGWKHECCSLDMVDMCLKHLGLEIDIDHLDEPLKQIGDGVDCRSIRVFVDESTLSTADREECVLTSRDWIFIKECIWGKPLPNMGGMVGRPDRNHEWMYDIVSNRHSGLDVDKIDYYARDDRRCCKESGEIKKHFLEEAFVTWAVCPKGDERCRCRQYEVKQGKHLMICYPDKMAKQAVKFFQERYALHEKIYQHKTVAAMALMICDIFCKADPFHLLPIRVDRNAHDDGADQKVSAVVTKHIPISRAMTDRNAFMMLRDSIIDHIEFTTSPELHPARALIYRLRSRDPYKLAGEESLDTKSPIHRRIWRKEEEEIKDEILACRGVHNDSGSSTVSLTDEDLVVMKVAIHHGLKDKNPLSQMRFLSKHQKMPELILSIADLPEATAVDEKRFKSQAPASFIEMIIRVYSRTTAKTELIGHVFKQWWAEANDEMELTPDNEGGSSLLVAEGASSSAAFAKLTQESDCDAEYSDDEVEDFESFDSVTSRNNEVMGKTAVTPPHHRKRRP